MNHSAPEQSRAGVPNATSELALRNTDAATSEPLDDIGTRDARPTIPDYEVLRQIGGGSYGDVWLVRSLLGT